MLLLQHQGPILLSQQQPTSSEPLPLRAISRGRRWSFAGGLLAITGDHWAGPRRLREERAAGPKGVFSYSSCAASSSSCADWRPFFSSLEDRRCFFVQILRPKRRWLHLSESHADTFFQSTSTANKKETASLGLVGEGLSSLPWPSSGAEAGGRHEILGPPVLYAQGPPDGIRGPFAPVCGLRGCSGP